MTRTISDTATPMITRPGPIESGALWALLAFSYATALLPADLPGLLALLAGWLPVAFAFWHFSRWAGGAAAVLSFIVIAAVSFTAEALGVATGLVFGDYHYADGPLGPLVLGVPPLILLQYFAMGYASLMIGRALVGAVGRAPSGIGGAVLATVLAAFALTALDLSSDPWQSTHLGDWVWPHGGAYFGVPLHNFIGWFSEALVFFGLVNALLARRSIAARLEERPRPRGFAVQGVLLYGTFPFAVVLRPLLHAPMDADADAIAEAMAGVALFAVLPLLVAALAALRPGGQSLKAPPRSRARSEAPPPRHG
ncbi:carotenoid biosynthesis protein [Microbacterium sp. CJ88]|uniref:carotenoid biosynthesis protein n=1 Tax=Microbacterium sp. CJ88 TaxID=3445672 RepID=UPI003F656FAD